MTFQEVRTLPLEEFLFATDCIVSFEKMRQGTEEVKYEKVDINTVPIEEKEYTEEDIFITD